jgi:hypothetical protein
VATFYERKKMKRLAIVCASFILLSYSLTTVKAQNEADLVSGINETLKEEESGWRCSALRSTSGIPTPESPQGISYQFLCKREEQSVLGSIFYGNSKHDAMRMLELSQKFLSINDSYPVDGIGEQAYEYAKQGSAWVTFRKNNVFGQLTVGLIDPDKMNDSSPEMKRLTAEVLEIAKRFAQHIVKQICAT